MKDYLKLVCQYITNMAYQKITKRDEYFINVAYNEAHNSKMLMKHGACVVENNKVIGVGCNSNRTRFKGNFIGVSCSCHAEMAAIFNAIKHKYGSRYFSVPRKRNPSLVERGAKGRYLQ